MDVVTFSGLMVICPFSFVLAVGIIVILNKFCSKKKEKRIIELDGNIYLTRVKKQIQYIRNSRRNLKYIDCKKHLLH